MHSWASSFRRNQAKIGVLATKGLSSHSLSPHLSRSLSTKPNTPLRRWNKTHDWSRSVSYGVLVGGSTLGLYCCSPLSGGGSFVSSADSGEPEKKSTFLFKDAYRRKVFFKYEKRIRTRSPPEKVFEYFASFKSPSGEMLMTAADLMRAVVPVFPPSEAEAVRGGALKGENITTDLHCPPSNFFMLFDTNKDGLISFKEYIFFVTILSIPESSFSVAFKMFDLNNDGGIDKTEFKKVMSLMRSRTRQGASHRDGMRSGLKVSSSVEEGGLLEYFFGMDGTKRLEHNKFVDFLRDLHDEMLRLEFAHYDYKSEGTISAQDFVLSMVASADMGYIDKFLDQVEEIEKDPNLSDLRITFENFKNFAMIRKRLKHFSMALFSYGKVNGQLSKQDFKRAANQVCGISLSDEVVDLVFYMFDLNKDGSLSSDEFLRVLERRETDISGSREEGLAALISCWLDCTRCSHLNTKLTSFTIAGLPDSSGKQVHP